MALEEGDIHLYHIIYEIAEYTFTIPKLSVEDQRVQQLLINMYWEHMAIHARNLILFFTDDTEKVRAGIFNHYKSITNKNDYTALKKNLNKRVAHISRERSDNFNWNRCIMAINAKLMPEIKSFLSHLSRYCLERVNHYTDENDRRTMKRFILDIGNLQSAAINCKIGIGFENQHGFLKF